MAVAPTNDGSEDVSDFLRRIEELGGSEGPDNQDLDQEIIESKRQREARRAERARSLSPDKQNPVVSPVHSARSPAKESFSTPRPVVLSPRTDPSRDSTSLSQAPLSPRENATRITASSPREPAAMFSPSRQQPLHDVEPSRADIAKSLGQKDPNWFRQTSDRGMGSAAYRKNNDEDNAPRGPRKLPGLFSSPDMPGSGWPSDHKEAEELTLENETSSASSSQPQDRSSGPFPPTKGMGGFVQSAMLRRTESVNKRWSAQAQTGAPRMNRSDENESSANAGEGAQDRSSVSAQSRRSRSPTKTTPGEAPPNGERPISHSPQKRWSPQKSSWLESALNKPPESPRIRHTPSQPSWLTDLNKNRQARMSKDEPQMSPNRPESALGKKSLDTQPDQHAPKGAEPSAPETPPAPAAEPEETPTTALSKLEGRAASSVTPPDKGSAAGKPKPITPPKKNHQSVGSMQGERKSQASQGDLEFQNAFGKLRRTQTSNYVAPDELKENVLRGKAGLAITGGPQKGERKDEFKESLLKKKASMNETGTDVKSVSTRPTSTGRKPSVPEAIAKRRAMTASQSGSETTSSTAVNGKGKPEPVVAAAKSGTVTESGVHPRQNETGKVAAPPGLSGKLAGRLNPALAGMIARGPQQSSKESALPPSRSESPKESSGPSPGSSDSAPLDHMTKSRARGPKRRPPKTTPETRPTEESPSIQGSHATADRDGNATPKQDTEVSKSQTSDHGRSIPESESPQKSSSGDKSPFKPEGFLAKATPPQAPNKPQILARKPDGISGSNSGEKSIKTSEDSTNMSLGTPDKATAQFANKPKMVVRPDSNGSSAGTSIRAVASRWTQSVAPDTQETVAPKQPIKLPTRLDEDNAAIDAGLIRTEQASTSVKGSPTVSSIAKAGLGSKVPSSRPAESTRNGMLSPKTPSTPVGARHDEREKTKETPTKGSHLSPKSPSSEASRTFAEFFETTPRAPEKLTINVSELLAVEQPGQMSKTKTLRKQIQLLGGDGKMSSTPATQEYILCDDKMYLCSHVFGDESGTRRTEVFLWTGSRVPRATAEDAQVFAKKAAKDAGGALHAVRQGKEGEGFFQALGGILVTRRGERQAREGYMLCGRKHLGHVAFDEVDFAPGSLCSGFAYLVSSPRRPESRGAKEAEEEEQRGGKLYLWKGKGCSADEVGCARLISMDLGGPGEVEEVEEGNEPEAFLEQLASNAGSKGGRAVPRSAEHWKLKAQQANYRTRLFHVEHHAGGPAARPDSQAGPSSPGPASLWNLVGRRGSQAETASLPAQRVKEIHPFCQADLEQNQVYVLDAFFEMYVLVGPASQARASSLATALMFAQDYAILAAGEQDRPFVPVGTVVMQGAPRDLKACFRGWDEGEGLFGPAAPEARKLRIVPLSAALAAVRP